MFNIEKNLIWNSEDSIPKPFCELSNKILKWDRINLRFVNCEFQKNDLEKIERFIRFHFYDSRDIAHSIVGITLRHNNEQNKYINLIFNG